MDLLVRSEAGEQQRSYEVVKSNLMLRAYYRMLIRKASSSMNIPQEELTLDIIIDYVCSDAALVNESMRKFYEGDHEGIDWADADAIQPELVEVALTTFFVGLLTNSLEKMKEQLTSSQPSADESPKRKKASRNRSGRANTK